MYCRKCRIVTVLIFAPLFLLMGPLFAEGQVSQAKVEYTVVGEDFPLKGGFLRVICISPRNNNETDLKSLAAILRVDIGNEVNAAFHIFDDEKAARMTKRDDLSDEEWAYLGQHDIDYRK